MKDVINTALPRVSVSRKRTINLGRFGLPYEAEEIFITMSHDILEEDSMADVIANLAERSETMLDVEVGKIESAFAVPAKPARIK